MFQAITHQLRSDRILRLLVLFSAMSMVLLVVRTGLTQNWIFSMLCWNLFLAWIPLVVILVVKHGIEENRLPAVLLWPGLLIWLLFLPNAPYIITDLFHVRRVSEQTLWFDAMMIFMFALTGLLAGMYSLWQVHRLLKVQLGSVRTWVIVLACLVLTSFGVYLGRYGRWNSWDLFTDPFLLTKAILTSIANPVALKLTLSYTFALLVFYLGLIGSGTDLIGPGRVAALQDPPHESMD